MNTLLVINFEDNSKKSGLDAKIASFLLIYIPIYIINKSNKCISNREDHKNEQKSIGAVCQP
jgi:hypothetical protein